MHSCNKAWPDGDRMASSNHVQKSYEKSLPVQDPAFATASRILNRTLLAPASLPSYPHPVIEVSLPSRCIHIK